MAQSHAGTLNKGYFGREASITCDCGNTYPAFRNPAEPDHYESPRWEAHVKDARTLDD